MFIGYNSLPVSLFPIRVLAAPISSKPLAVSIRKEPIKLHALLQERRAMRQKKPIVGTIVRVFDGALDGLRAQLISRTRFGYTVKLLESKDAFRKGDRVYLSMAEFTINKGETHWR